MSLDPVDVARRLIAVPSPSGHEAEVARLLLPLLEQIGLSVTVQPIPSAPERFNLIAAAGGPPEVLLCTHLDVVSPHLASREDEAWLYGRGACDAKGILAAMLAAAERLKNDGVTSFALLLVVGEETDSIGAKTAADRLLQTGFTSRFVVVGEPTEMRFARGQKGGLKAELTARGRAAHSAVPERGESALLKMMSLLQDLATADWGEHPTLGPATLNIGELHAGVGSNVVPAEARASIMVRVVDSTDAVERRLRSLVADRATVEVVFASEPQEIFVPSGSEGVVVAFNTDIPFLRALGRPVLLGPGSILEAHADGEKVAKQELHEAASTYHRLVRDLIASAG